MYPSPIHSPPPTPPRPTHRARLAHSFTATLPHHHSLHPSPSCAPPPPPPQQAPPVLSPVFIDTIARDFSLEQKQTQMLHTFVGFGSLGAGLSLPDLVTRVVLLAAQFGDAAERRRKEKAEEQDKTDHRAIWRDLQVRLEETFCFTRQQKAHIHGVVQDIIYEGDRTKFLTLHVDVWDVVTRRKVELNLENIFGVPGREKSLGQLIKKQCSGIQNSYRTDISGQLIASVDPKKFTSIEEFVYLTAAAAAEEEEADDSDVDYDQAEERRTRKRAKKSGKVGKGGNFWGSVDSWFKKQVKERGSTLTGSKWKSYVDQLLKDDRAKFKGLLPGTVVAEQRNVLLDIEPSSNQQTPGAGAGPVFQSSGHLLESMMHSGGSYSSVV
ncbi:hypothetical protein R3P38DRAFT_2805827 [Favolaschia claudopus]|uniref:Uncharacterized protein n=1 Tax=Favolaschia claudopus TaxID=2862362 RepID=A0AAV9ZLL5_9AGAR